MENIVIDILYLIVPYCDEFVSIMIFVLFILAFNCNKENKNITKQQTDNMKLVNTEYSLSTQGNKKYRIRKIYVDKATGKPYIVDEYTNDEILKNKNKSN